MEHTGDLSPSQMEAVEASGALRYLKRTFPVYGLPASWRGARLCGDAEESTGTDGSGQVVHRETSLGLVHVRDLERHDEEHVQVTSSRVGPASGERPVAEAVSFVLASRVEDIPPDDGPDETEPTTPVRLLLDGLPTDFEMVVGARGWVAQTRRADHTITVESRGVPVEEVELVTVEDVGPYVEGRQALLDLLQQRWS